MSEQEGSPTALDTANLQHTAFMPSLAAAIPPGKSAVWCASLTAAWERLVSFLGEPVRLSGAESLCADLNGAPKSSVYLPRGEWYAAAGAGISDEIARGMKARFPDRPAHVVSAPEGGILAFAYLQCFFQFAHAYEDSRQPLLFRGESGKPVAVRSFGVREEDQDKRMELRMQVRVLFGGPRTRRDAFALDLCRDSNPMQIVVAHLPRGASLLAMIDEVRARTAAEPPGARDMPLFPGGVMLVPNMDWNVRHCFAEFRGKVLANSAWAGIPIEVKQEIRFRLDRRGVALTSEATIHLVCASSERYVLDGPFLLYLKRRDADMPFFAMWVANAELLEPFEEGSGRPAGGWLARLVGAAQHRVGRGTPGAD